MSSGMPEPVKIPRKLLLVMRGAYIIASVWVGFQVYSMLQSAWASPNHPLERKLFFTGFLGGATWFLVAAFFWGIKGDPIDPDSTWDFLLGPRPIDPTELAAWRWGRYAIYGVVVAAVSWMALVLAEIIRWVVSVLSG